MTRLLLAFIATAALLLADSPETCRGLDHHGKRAQAQSCYAQLTRSNDPYLAAEGNWGLREYTQANDGFRAALKIRPQSADIRVRWGRLLLERFNPQDAMGLFQEALKIDPNCAAAYVGMALVASETFESKAVAYAKKGAELDPKLVEARELLSYLALEENDNGEATSQAEKAMAISPEALDAMAVLASIDLMAGRNDTPWIPRILRVNPVYGQAWATAGHFFVINRRYQEGISCYRKALELEPKLEAARAQLGVNLMRLGHDDEARRNLEAAYAGGYRNAETVNSLRLLDSESNFETFRTATTVLRLHKKEADLLRPYFEEQMQRAIATYDRKYKMKPPGPVEIQAFPDHGDLLVIATGLPDELGLLGVTFGMNVAMDSPSSRPPGTNHWASTMWHEMSHVYVLTATHHLVPRWFTEGEAVHEETAASPDWGDRMGPDEIEAIRDHKLLPVEELDRGFVRPSYPAQVLVSYFEAGKICDYIAGKWGDDKILDMIHSFAAAKTTPEAIQAGLGMTPSEFDKQFQAWLYDQTKTTVEHFAEWRKREQVVAEDVHDRKYDDAIREGKAIRDWYPDFVETNSIYELLADAYLEKGDKADAVAQLEAYSRVGGRNPAAIKQLAALETNPAVAAKTLERLLYIYPEDENLHSSLGDLLMKTGDPEKAIREYQAVLASNPVDLAHARFNLAQAYKAVNRVSDAKEQVLMALEAAPDYKPAQKLLLEIMK